MCVFNLKTKYFTNYKQMENKILDIVKMIEENPITKLTKPYQSKFINKIKDKFNTEEQQLFVASFYGYLNYKKDEFIIDFDNTFKWLKFASKQKAKELLLKYFIVDIDYKIIFIQKVENHSLGGRPSETILMTLNTFKKFCMKANTKKSSQIHDYMIKLEEILFEVIDEESSELRQQLDNKQFELEQTQNELKKEQDKKNLLLKRRFQNVKPNECVYYYKDDEHEKIGKSVNISEREIAYSNLNKTGKIIYFQNCLNCNLVEKVLHHIFDKYRTIRTEEWFSFPSEELVIQTIKSIIYIIDSQMENIDKFIPKLYELLNIKNFIPENHIIEIIKNDINLINPTDFDKFINECCELNKSNEYFCPKSELKQAHRVWSKCNNKNVISKLDTYLDNKFKSTTKFIDDIRRNLYLNVRLKPLEFNISDKNLDYEQFIKEECKIDYQYRISYTDFFHYFIDWKKKTDPYYKLQIKYRKEIQTNLEKIFAGGRVHISGGNKATHLYGLWGCGHSSTNFGLKNPDRTNKQVEQYNSKTNELIHTFDSLSIASRDLKISLSSLSNYCRFNTGTDNWIFKYK